MSIRGGQGSSFLTQLGQAPGPINNQELFYTFQGLTNDGGHYVVAILPVTHASLPDNFDRLTETERKAVEDNFAQYIDEAVKALEGQADASFRPSLVDLDAVVRRSASRRKPIEGEHRNWKQVTFRRRSPSVLAAKERFCTEAKDLRNCARDR